MNRPLIISALTDGFGVPTLFGKLSISVASAGDLSLPSGRLVACDPGLLMHQDAWPAFSRTVTPGSYPVHVSTANFENGNVRVAQAAVILNTAPPVRFELATRPGEDVATLGADEVFAHGVDSGTSCFVDVDAAQLILERCKDWDYCWKGGFAELRTPGQNRCKNAVIDPASGLNMIVFESGIGDGRYASYWGFDSHDQLVCLVTDFNLIAEKDCFFPRCPECKALEGELHHNFPCNAERCPFCGNWVCACGCMATILGLSKEERALADKFYEKLWWKKDRKKWTEIQERWKAEMTRKGRVPYDPAHLK